MNLREKQILTQYLGGARTKMKKEFERTKEDDMARAILKMDGFADNVGIDRYMDIRMEPDLIEQIVKALNSIDKCAEESMPNAAPRVDMMQCRIKAEVLWLKKTFGIEK